MPRHVTDVESNGNITALQNENIRQFSQHNTLQLFDFEICAYVRFVMKLTFIPKHWSITFFVMKMWTNMSAQGKMKREASGSFSTRILMELYWCDWSSLCYGDTTWKWKEIWEIPHAVRTSAFAVLKFAMLLLEIKHVLKLHFSDWQPSVSKSAKCCRSSQWPIHLQQLLKRTNHKATNGTNGTNSQRIRAGLRIQTLQLLARATKGQSGLCM